MTKPKPPEGVELFDVATAEPTGNFILDITGDAKTGKSHFLVRGARPLYLVYADPNTNLDAVLLKAAADGYDGDIYKMALPPIPYDELERDEASAILTKVTKFAKWARKQGRGGTFAIDGCIYLKGYFEKAILGESATLGFRAKRGESGPSTIQYGQSNSAFKDFIAGFVDSDLDVLMTWEGREIWRDVWDSESGKKNREPTGGFKTSSPRQLAFVTSAAVEMLVTLDPVMANDNGVTKPTGATKVGHHVRIGPNGYNPKLRGMSIDAEVIKDPDALKGILFAYKPKATAEAVADADAQVSDAELVMVDPEAV